MFQKLVKLIQIETLVNKHIQPQRVTWDFSKDKYECIYFL